MYKVRKSKQTENLELQVDKLISEGYLVYGNLVMRSLPGCETFFIQVMVKPESLGYYEKRKNRQSLHEGISTPILE